MIIDFTLIENNHNLTKEQDELLVELQPTFVNGHCHSLTALISYFYPDFKIKTLHLPSSGMIHSFLEIKDNVYLDASGITSNLSDILSNYSHMEIKGNDEFFIKDSDRENIIKPVGLEDYDIEHAFEFWYLIQNYYNVSKYVNIETIDFNDNFFDKFFK